MKRKNEIEFIMRIKLKYKQRNVREQQANNWVIFNNYRIINCWIAEDVAGHYLKQPSTIQTQLIISRTSEWESKKCMNLTHKSWNVLKLEITHIQMRARGNFSAIGEYSSEVWSKKTPFSARNKNAKGYRLVPIFRSKKPSICIEKSSIFENDWKKV